ncbi:hypothetical protein ABK040_003821 [Willaertia magna]
MKKFSALSFLSKKSKTSKNKTHPAFSLLTTNSTNNNNNNTSLRFASTDNALGKVESPKGASSSTDKATDKATTGNVNVVGKVKPKTSLRASIVSLLAGAAIFGSVYYYMRDIIEKESKDLIQKTKSIEALKTKRQLEEEDKIEEEKLHQLLLKKRQLSQQLPEEKDKTLFKLLLLKFYRNWNSIFYNEVLNGKIDEEVRIRFGVGKGQYVIQSVKEE